MRSARHAHSVYPPCFLLKPVQCFKLMYQLVQMFDHTVHIWHEGRGLSCEKIAMVAVCRQWAGTQALRRYSSPRPLLGWTAIPSHQTKPNGDYHFFIETIIVPLRRIESFPPDQRNVVLNILTDFCIRGTSSCAISNSRHCELISTSLTGESITKSILTTTTATWPQKGTCFVAADRFLCGTAKKRSYVCDSHRRPTDGTRPNTDRT